MKKLMPIMGWICAVLLILIPGLLIMHFGYENMMIWARVALCGMEWFTIVKGIVIAFIYLIVDIFGVALIITALICALFVIREYILPKNNEQQSETDENGYTEV